MILSKNGMHWKKSINIKYNLVKAPCKNTRTKYYHYKEAII